MSTTATSVVPLAELPLVPYIDASGAIPTELNGKIGAYAIFDSQETLQLVGLSRNICQSLKQHLVRCPEQCHGFKVQTIDRPSRAILQEIQSAWLAENGGTPPGNDADKSRWQDAIDVKPLMTEDEKAAYAAADERGQMKVLKQSARRVQATILEKLRDRGVEMEIRFNPKQKELGLLDLK